MRLEEDAEGRLGTPVTTFTPVGYNAHEDMPSGW
jgi:hypothetical protein